jgi:DNA-binding response OmpR family regulator
VTVAIRAEDQAVSTAFKIVVVEEAPEPAASIAATLRREGFQVHIAADAATGLGLIESLGADLAILDITGPGIDGAEACRRLRLFSDAYVIMLTARASEADRLTGLTAGADDYMTKPFYPGELVARIRAMQRRPRRPGASLSMCRFGDLTIEPETQRVRIGEAPIELSRIEYRLLSVLAAGGTRITTRAELLRRVWGEGWVGDDHLVDVHICNLRHKLGDDPADPSYITTVRGRGFSMRGVG